MYWSLNGCHDEIPKQLLPRRILTCCSNMHQAQQVVGANAIRVLPYLLYLLRIYCQIVQKHKQIWLQGCIRLWHDTLH